MFKKFLFISLVLILSFSVMAEGQKEKAQGAGETMYDASENWDQIYENAKSEGKVVFYCLSSRVFDVVEKFKEKYPGIEVDAFDIPTVEQTEKLTREQQIELYNADVLLLADATTLFKELLPKGYIKNYIPSKLVDGKDTKKTIPEFLREPLLVHSIESKVIFYNTEKYSSSPIKNLWDLTDEKWKNKVHMKDPMLAAENLNLLQSIVEHSDAMAAAYKKKYGKDIVLSPGSKNAGYEFISRLVKNDLVLTTSDGKAAKAVGAEGQDDPPVTLSVASSKLRYNKKGMKLGVAWDVEPKFGISKRNFIAYANNAPHPNAAKLLIRFLLGDANGGGGFTPFNVPGQWSSRSDVMNETKITFDDLKKKSWFVNPDYIYSNGLAVRDFWISQ